MPRKREPSKPTGRFVPCSASFAAHEGWVFAEVHLSANGKWFAFCGRCRSRVFLNTWGEGWGFTLAQVEAPVEQGGWGAQVDIPPPRRAELMSGRRKKKRATKTTAAQGRA